MSETDVLAAYIDMLTENDLAVNDAQVDQTKNRPTLLTDKNKRVPCVDVVVPMFWLDMKIPSRTIALRASVPANITFWITIDNPGADSKRLNAVRAMEKLDNQYAVNILGALQ